jgi:putative transposase
MVKGLGVIMIRVPVDRRRQFESQIVPKHERIDPRLVEDMAALHLAGLSTRTMSLMSERLLGVKISHEKVSSSLPTLGQEALQWLKRPLNRNRLFKRICGRGPASAVRQLYEKA